MRVAVIYRNGILAGSLTELSRNAYQFSYDDGYFRDATKAAISLTLPKTEQFHYSPFLFPFFFNMLSEGVNRKLQCRQLQIDEEDHFGLLLATAQFDTIGAITVKAISNEHI